MVVGGSSGIGSGVVEGLLGSGAQVIYASRTKGKNNSSVIHVEADVSNESSVSSLFKEVDRFGDLDFLVNAAGASSNTRLSKLELAEWDFVISSNLKSTFLCCKAAISRMKKNSFGRVVNISSIAGKHKSIVAGVHYVSSKAGVIGLTKQLAHELSDTGINVNVVAPSQTLTPLLEAAMTKDELNLLSKNIPLRRIAEVREQVGPILFLLSDAASYINGAVIDVNGGQI